jgi:uncharacterized membrane protein YgdD (TMEM256/DUF423 family)
LSARDPRPGAGLRLLLVLGALAALASIVLGAVAAHGLEGRLAPSQMQALDTAVRYLGLHALAVLVTGALCVAGRRNPWLHAAGWLFLAGTVLFSGSIALKLLAGIGSVGFMTPYGGLVLMLGWASLSVGAWRLRNA